MNIGDLIDAIDNSCCTSKSKAELIEEIAEIANTQAQWSLKDEVCFGLCLKRKGGE